MSRAFVKEMDEVDDLPDRPISEQPNDVTTEGLQQIEKALSAAQATHDDPEQYKRFLEAAEEAG